MPTSTPGETPVLPPSNLQPESKNPEYRIMICVSFELTPCTLRQVMTIAEGLRERYSLGGGSDVALRMSFVAYRDYHSKGSSYAEGEVKVCSFTEDIAVLRSMVRSQRAVGGGDGPEDLCGGLRAALALDWCAQSRHLFIVADAPCHGKDYHDYSDTFPEGDPKGDKPEEQLAKLTKDLKVSVKLIQVNSLTDSMLAVINRRLRDTHDCREVAKVGPLPRPTSLRWG